MNGLAEVIPIASRRALKKKGIPPRRAIDPAITPQKRRRRLYGFCAILLGLVLGLIALDGSVLPHSRAEVPAPLSSEMRQGLYQRALDDVVSACAVPQAKAGLLRQHCLDQARFLQQLPECTGDCTRLTRGVLNQR
jgi:hypothetical protein